MKTTTNTYPTLPAEVPGGCYRFFAKVLRTSFFDRTVTLEVDGDEYTLPNTAVNVGLVEGKLVADIRERVAKNFGLC